RSQHTFVAPLGIDCSLSRGVSRREWIIVDQRDAAVVALNKRRATLHPITTVVICHLAKFPNGRAMDMAAENAIHLIAFRVMCDSSFEFTDEADGIFHPPLCIRAKRPVPQTEPSSDEIDE